MRELLLFAGPYNNCTQPTQHTNLIFYVARFGCGNTAYDTIGVEPARLTHCHVPLTSHRTRYWSLLLHTAFSTRQGCDGMFKKLATRASILYLLISCFRAHFRFSQFIYFSFVLLIIIIIISFGFAVAPLLLSI